MSKNESDLAEKYLIEQVLPILTKNEFTRMQTPQFYLLVETILVFPNQEEESMEKFKDNITKMVKVESMGRILRPFLKNPAVFKHSAPIRELCESYHKWLISQKPEFSWCMPRASMIEFPQVEDFLKSELEQMKLENVFSGIVEARRFATKYNQSKNQNRFSFNAVPDGIGRKAYVVITKTKDNFSRESSSFKECEQEIEDLENFLK